LWGCGFIVLVFRSWLVGCGIGICGYTVRMQGRRFAVFEPS